MKSVPRPDFEDLNTTFQKRSIRHISLSVTSEVEEMNRVIVYRGKIHVREEIMDRARTLENPPRERAWDPSDGLIQAKKDTRNSENAWTGRTSRYRTFDVGGKKFAKSFPDYIKKMLFEFCFQCENKQCFESTMPSEICDPKEGDD